MARIVWTLPVLALLSGLLSIPAPLEAQDSEEDTPVDTISVLDRVYTEEQAAEGGDLYQAECAACHPAADFSGPVFELSWADRPLWELFQVTAITMPQDQPGNLTDEEYAAVIAYILEMNNYPHGEDELGFDEDTLSAIMLDPPPDHEDGGPERR